MTILGATWFAALMGLSPVKASIVGAQLAGWPGMASEVIDICEDESLCEPIGLHRGPLDRVDGGTVWKRAVEQGLLGSCDHHAQGDGERWGVRGVHGNIGAYAVHDLGVCVAPEALDVPILSAIATARRLGRLVTRYRKRTAQARSHAWRHGVGCKCDQPAELFAVVGWQP